MLARSGRAPACMGALRARSGLHGRAPGALRPARHAGVGVRHHSCRQLPVETCGSAQGGESRLSSSSPSRAAFLWLLLILWFAFFRTFSGDFLDIWPGPSPAPRHSPGHFGDTWPDSSRRWVLWPPATDFFNHTPLYTSGNRENTVCCVHLSLGFVCTRRRSSGCCGLRPPIFVQSHSLVHLRQYQLPGPGPATASPRMDAQSITSAYGGYGAEVARLTPDHKVGSSNHLVLTILSPQRSDCNRATSRQ